MPELKWNEYEVIECLGVLPEFDSFFTSHYYKVEKDALILEMTIWQYESLIAISLSQSSNKKPFITFYFVVRQQVKFINEKDFALLRFCDCVVVPRRFWMNESGDVFNKDQFTSEFDIDLKVYPHLEISFG